MLKKTITAVMLAATVLSSWAGGTVTLAWDVPTDPTVSIVKIYAVPGNMTAFTTGNANATVTVAVGMPTNSVSISNLATGPWSFVATCLNTNGLESVNSVEITANIIPAPVTNLRVTGTHTP